MMNFVIATNREGSVEAFYIDGGTVMTTYQLEPNNKLVWSPGKPLIGTGPNSSGPITDAVRVEATTDIYGQIQVIVFTESNQFLTCYQTPGNWSGWYQITQQQQQ